jgi:triosephosphate isomerase
MLPRAKRAGQNCFWREKGSYTGEISPEMLKDIGCNYVIVGHSERRKILKEGDEVINKKIRKALETGLSPILCIGEEKEDKREGKTFKVLEKQLKKDLKDIKKKDLPKVIIAYEPVWAIGRGTPCEENQVMTISLFIKKTITQLANKKIAEKVKIIYGGSVGSENLLNYTKGLALDGFLVGGSSLRPKEFSKMIKELERL